MHPAAPEQQHTIKSASKPPLVAAQHQDSLDDRLLDMLASRARGGDRSAAARLCAALTPAVSRYFHRTLRDDHEASDATQHVMVQLLVALPKFRDQGAPFRALVFRIAHNHGLDRNRLNGRSLATDPDELARLRESADLDCGTTRREQRDSFEALIAILPPAQQHVIRLIYLHDLSPRQVGQVLGRTPEDIRQQHKRGRDSLCRLVLSQST